MAALNVLPPTHVPRVTEYVDTIIQYIDRIMKNRCAYATPSGKLSPLHLSSFLVAQDRKIWIEILRQMFYILSFINI